MSLVNNLGAGVLFAPTSSSTALSTSVESTVRSSFIPVQDAVLNSLKIKGIDSTSIDMLQGLYRTDSSVQALYVDGCTLTVEVIKCFAMLFPNISELNIINSRIDGDALVALQKLSELRELSFIEVPGLIDQHLSDLKMLQLTQLRFQQSGTDFTHNGLSNLIHMPLSLLVLQNTMIGDNSLAVIGNFSCLKQLILDDCEDITNRGIFSLSRCQTLEVVRLLECPNIDDRALKSLATLPKLRMLHLSNNHVITNSGLAAFRKGALHYLGLNSTPQINASGILGLTGSVDSLQSLNVKGCHQFDTDALHKIVSVFQRIQKINSTTTSVCSKEVTVLAPSPIPPQPEFLALARMQEVPGAVLKTTKITTCNPAFLDAVREQGATDPSVRSIRLVDSVVTADIIKKLALLFPNAIELEIRKSSIEGRALTAFSQFRFLTEVSFIEVPGLADSHLSELRPLALTKLRFQQAGESFTFAGFGNLINMPLSLLVLQNTVIGDEELSLLGHFHSLKQAILDNCERVTNIGIQKLSKCKELEVVRLLNCPGFDDVAMESLATLSKLRMLHLSNNHRLSDVGLGAFSKQPLCYLGLNGISRVSSAGILSLKGAIKHLQNLNIHGCSQLGNHALERVVPVFRELQKVDLSFTSVCGRALKLLANLPIRTLVASHCHFDDTALSDLTDLCSKGLQVLDLSRTRISGAGKAALQKAFPDLRIA